MRVTRWDFAPGAETGWHRHGWLYAVVPVTDGTLLLELAEGKTMTAELQAGISYSRTAGTEHNVTVSVLTLFGGPDPQRD